MCVVVGVQSMKATLAAKAALCICPTLVMGTVAVKSPKARQAVHKMTASKSVKKPGVAKRRAPQQYASLSLPCPPAFVGIAPALAGLGLPMTGLDVANDLFGTLTPFSGGGGGGGSFGPGIVLGGGGGGGPGGGSGGGGGGGGAIEPDAPPVAGTVPEPESWIFMIIGFAALGGTLRWQRRRMRNAHYSWGGWTPIRAKAAFAAGATLPDAIGVAAVSTKLSFLAKAALCVCPPVMIASVVATVPAARQAVHSATAPQKSIDALRFATPRPLEPCNPSIESAARGSALGEPKAIPAVVSVRELYGASQTI